jgi:hypothetical protein
MKKEFICYKPFLNSIELDKFIQLYKNNYENKSFFYKHKDYKNILITIYVNFDNNGLINIIETQPQCLNNINDQIYSDYMLAMKNIIINNKFNIQINGLTFYYLYPFIEGGYLKLDKKNDELYKLYLKITNLGKDSRFFSYNQIYGYNIQTFDNFINIIENKSQNKSEKLDFIDNIFKKDIKRFYLSESREKIFLVLTEKEHNIKNNFVCLLLSPEKNNNIKIKYFEAFEKGKGVGSAAMKYLYENFQNKYNYILYIDYIEPNKNTSDYKWDIANFWEKMKKNGYIKFTKNVYLQIQDYILTMFKDKMEELLNDDDDGDITYTNFYEQRNDIYDCIQNIITNIKDK